MGSYLQTVLWCTRFSEAKNLHTVECSQLLETKNYQLHSMCSILVANFSASHRLCSIAIITGKPHGMRSILKLTSVNWMLFLHFYGFLKLKPASGRYSQHLEIIICRLHNVAWCLQRVATNICKLHGLCHILKPTCAICLGPATLWSNMCTWKSARSILELGLRFFLPAVLLPSFLPSLPPSFFPFLLSGLCSVFFSCWFSILIPFSFDKFTRGSRCKCSMQQVCQLLWWGEQPTALVAAWTEGMSAVAWVEAS